MKLRKNSVKRLLRGGSFNFEPRDLCNTVRDKGAPQVGSRIDGLRLVIRKKR